MLDVEALREGMPSARHYSYMDHAATSPLPARTSAAMRKFLDEAELHGHVRGGLYPESKRVRQLAARLVNCHPEEVTFVKNTSEGVSYVANGLQFSRGDNIVTTAVEFPANVYPWMNLQNIGVQLKMVPADGGRVPTERIVQAIDGRTRIVTVSSVQFASGHRADLQALGNACQERGVLFFVDAIQSLGVIPMDVRGMKIDFLSAGGHKWMMGSEGVGLFYCRHELLGLLRPSSIGWLNVKNAQDYGSYKLDFRDDARRFDGGSYNLAGIWGLGASIEWLLDIGVDKIWERVRGLTDKLSEGVRRKGYRVVSPRETGEASGIVAFVSDTHDHSRIVSHLKQEYRTIIAQRMGRLRASPHFYNTDAEIDALIAHLPGH